MRTFYKLEKEIDGSPLSREVMKTGIERITLMRQPLAALMNLEKKAGTHFQLMPAADTLRNMRRAVSTRHATTMFRISRTVRGKVFDAVYTPYVAESARARKHAVDCIRDNIRQYRRYSKRNADVLINRSPGWVVRRFNENLLNTNKRPKDAETYVGIEIECIMPDDADMKRLLPFGKYISIVGDGSIEPDGGEQGREIRVCVKRSEVRDVIPKLVETLVDMGGRVNRSCGLHVHLDQRGNKEPEKAFQKLVRALPLLYTVVPASRQENTYCKRNRHGNFRMAANGSRYRAINASAFYKHQTIEVRLFGGTLEASKIINWVETLHAITDGDMLLRCPKNFDTARNHWKLSEENAAWLKARQAKYGAALADTVEAQSDVVDVPLELAQNLEMSEAA